MSFADALLRVEAVFGDLGRNPAFAAPVKRLVSQLFRGMGRRRRFLRRVDDAHKRASLDRMRLSRCLVTLCWHLEAHISGFGERT